MLLIRILSGKMAGDQTVARHFPFHIGRSAKSNLCLRDAGVWEEHVRLERSVQDGYVCEIAGEARVSMDGEPVRERQRVSNGSLLNLGAVNLRVSLAPPSQKGMAFTRAGFWLVVSALFVGQVALIIELLS